MHIPASDLELQIAGSAISGSNPDPYPRRTLKRAGSAHPRSTSMHRTWYRMSPAERSQARQKGTFVRSE